MPEERVHQIEEKWYGDKKFSRLDSVWLLNLVSELVKEKDLIIEVTRLREENAALKLHLEAYRREADGKLLCNT